MSKVPKPETVAVVVSDFAIFWAGSGPVAPMIERNSVKVGTQLVTAEQMESYAAARVAEALEAALSVANEKYKQAEDAWMGSAMPYDEGAMDASDVIAAGIAALQELPNSGPA